MRVLVTGAGGPAGRALTRQLSDGGHVVIGLDMDAVNDNLLAAREIVPAASDPSMIPRLRDLTRSHDADLVIPTVSDELPQVALAATGLLTFAPVVIGTPDAVATAHDKFLTMVRLAAANVPVPKFALPRDFADTASAMDALGPELVIKPRIGRGSRGVRIITEPAQVSWTELGDDVIVQQYAPGDEYAPMVYAPAGGDTPRVAVVEKSGSGGCLSASTAIARVPSGQAADVAAIASRATEALGLTGPVDLDLRRLDDGQPVVLEVNARFGANSELAPEILGHALAEYAPLVEAAG